MTSQEFLHIFERHLRVGEPKRSEIIAELQEHLHRAETINRMGNPKKVALEENQIHIGFFADPWRLYLIPVALLVLQLFVKAIIASSGFFQFENIWASISMLGLLLVAIEVGRVLPRTEHASNILKRLLWISLACVLIQEFISQKINNYTSIATWIAPQYRLLLILGPFINAAFATAVLFGVVVVTSRVSQPLFSKQSGLSPKTVRRETIVIAVLTLLVFIVVSLLGEALAPVGPTRSIVWDILFGFPLAAGILAGLAAVIFSKYLVRYRRTHIIR